MKDLDVLPAESEKLLVFVSAAGIDRCAMAKVLLNWLLARRKTGVRLRIESAGKWPPYYPRARKSGCKAIEELCGDDLLASHRSQVLSDMLKERADLILVMSESLLPGLPESKTYNLKEFFGMEGKVEDPVFDNEDEASLRRYRTVAEELKSILEDEGNLQKLIEYLRD